MLFILVCMPFISFSFFTEPARTSSTMLNSSGKSNHPFLVLDLRKIAFSLSSLSMMLALKFFVGASCKVEKIPFNSYFAAWFYHEWMMSFVKCFMCLFCKDLISFVYKLNSMDRFLMLKQCYIPGINVSLSWYIIFFNIIGFSF